MTERPDSALVRECLQGERSAFEALVGRHERKVFNVVYRMVHDRDDARDLTQSTFLKAFRGLASFDLRREFRSWLFRIAINESLNFLKSVDRRRSAPLDEMSRPAPPTPEEVLAGIERSRQVREALMALPAEQRALIVLRHLVGCSYADIAGILEVPEKTVKSRLFSARQALRGCWASRRSG